MGISKEQAIAERIKELVRDDVFGDVVDIKKLKTEKKHLWANDEKLLATVTDGSKFEITVSRVA